MKLSDAQLVAFYDHARDEFGAPKLDMTPLTRPLSEKEVFRRRCYLLGISDRKEIAKLWAEDEPRRKAAREALKKRPPRNTRTRPTTKPNPEGMP